MIFNLTWNKNKLNLIRFNLMLFKLIYVDYHWLNKFNLSCFTFQLYLIKLIQYFLVYAFVGPIASPKARLLALFARQVSSRTLLPPQNAINVWWHAGQSHTIIANLCKVHWFSIQFGIKTNSIYLDSIRNYSNRFILINTDQNINFIVCLHFNYI